MVCAAAVYAMAAARVVKQYERGVVFRFGSRSEEEMFYADKRRPLVGDFDLGLTVSDHGVRLPFQQAAKGRKLDLVQLQRSIGKKQNCSLVGHGASSLPDIA